MRSCRTSQSLDALQPGPEFRVSQTSDHVTLFLQVLLVRLAFCGSTLEAGGLGQSPLLGKAPRGSEQGLLSSKTEQRVGAEW